MKIYLFVLVFIMSVFAQDTNFDEHISISKEEYKKRRQAAIDKLEDGPAILMGNVSRNRINDTSYEFRQESNFYYLSGFNEPNGYMILSKEPFEVNGKMVNEVIFVPENSLQSITWTGKRLGTYGAINTLGFDAALPTFIDHDNNRRTPAINNFEEFLKKMALKHQSYYVNTPIIHSHTFGDHTESRYKSEFVKGLKKSLEKAIKDSKLKDVAQTEKIDDEELVEIHEMGEFREIMTDLRKIKSPKEVKMLQRAVDVTNTGHFEAFKIAKDAKYEYQVEAAIEYAFKFNGAEDVGYNSIVGCGMNGTILHYETNREKYKHNEMFVLDAGAEYQGYTADITRSFPADGTFSKEQKEIYQIVLDAQNAGAAMFKAGKTYRDVAIAISNVQFEGLKRLGILVEDKSIEDEKKREQDLRRKMWQITLHGWGHPVGLDVHDPTKRNDTFKEDMIWTIEPGLYISDRITFDVPEKYIGIAVRIEDMYRITKGGNEHMSKHLPREISEIEDIMEEDSDLLLAR